MNPDALIARGTRLKDDLTISLLLLLNRHVSSTVSARIRVNHLSISISPFILLYWPFSPFIWNKWTLA